MSSSKKPFLSIVVPCYNESVNIHLGALDKIARFLEKQSYSFEGIIADDGSTDDSPDRVKEFVKKNKHFRLLQLPHRGKAHTVVDGMLESEGEYILFMDMDQAVPIDEIDKLLPWFEKGYDVVIGSRKTKRHGAPLMRQVMAKGFMLLREYILGMESIIDTQCGFKAFRNIAAKTLGNQLKKTLSHNRVSGSRVTASFDVEMLFLAQKKGFSIKEVSVQWHHVDTRRVNPIRDSFEGLIGLLKIRANDKQGLYR